MDLFQHERQYYVFAEGAVLLGGLALDSEQEIFSALGTVTAQSPFRHMTTPNGHRMSVAMTNCGHKGWTAQRSGYQYSSHDPLSGALWPAMPEAFSALAQKAAQKAGYPAFLPDACLINRYATGSKLSLHQDKDELDLSAPIISVSLGVGAVFLFGGLERHHPTQKIRLSHGDVVVWGGASRLAYHGIQPLKAGTHPMTGEARINLTFRKVRN